jgi:TetR/AcrR family transcriptional regulator
MTNRSDDDVLDRAAAVAESITAGEARKRPKPGERRVQILQTLASML